MDPNVPEALVPLLVPVDRLKPDPRNARQHPARNLEAICSSLKRFGQRKPIVANRDGMIEAGNGLYEAALSLGWDKVAVSWVDDDNPTAAAYALADNRTAELAEWDFGALADVARELQGSGFDMTELGWADHELEPLLNADWSPPIVDPNASFDPSAGGAGNAQRVVVFTHEQWGRQRSASGRLHTRAMGPTWGRAG